MGETIDSGVMYQLQIYACYKLEREVKTNEEIKTSTDGTHD